MVGVKRSNVEGGPSISRRRKTPSELSAILTAKESDLRAKQTDLTAEQKKVAGWMSVLKELDNEHMKEAREVAGARLRYQKLREDIINRYNAGTGLHLFHLFSCWVL